MWEFTVVERNVLVTDWNSLRGRIAQDNACVLNCGVVWKVVLVPVCAFERKNDCLLCLTSFKCLVGLLPSWQYSTERYSRFEDGPVSEKMSLAVGVHRNMETLGRNCVRFWSLPKNSLSLTSSGVNWLKITTEETKMKKYDRSYDGIGESDLLAEIADRSPEDFTIESCLVLLIDITCVGDLKSYFTDGQCCRTEVQMDHLEFR